MKQIEILDCTLRDGGRVIDCKYSDATIVGLGRYLKRAGIDIIELGFLRDNINFKGNSTFFSSMSDAEAYIKRICEKELAQNERYVVFVDFGLYNLAHLEAAEKNDISGIRLGFTKTDYLEHKNEVIGAMKTIKEKNYDLYFQTVNSNGYTTTELLELIEIANIISPKSFGIVDTYGSMYLDDLEYMWSIVNRNLDRHIAVDFHSHNNMQMSFALTQRMIQLAADERKLIIDATLNGIGKCAGNLNTELLVDYLSRKRDYDYDTDVIFDAIDRYMYPIKKENNWGYSIPAFMAGIYKAHPNNVIYLTEKYRLNNKDIKYILSGIDEGKRQRYDYQNIQRVYKEYSSCRVNDNASLKTLSEAVVGKEVLVLASGKTVMDYAGRILEYIEKNNPVVICVNFIPRNINCDYYFYANTIHWEKVSKLIEHSKCIVSSNIHTEIENVYLIEYSRLIAEDSPLFDNSTIMLLNLLNLLLPAQITLAGFDGLNEKKDNYVEGTCPNKTGDMDYQEFNREITELLRRYKNKTQGKIIIHFLTPSKYDVK